MYIQKFYPEKFNLGGLKLGQPIMLHSMIFLCAGLLFCPSTWALSTDKNELIEITADGANLDKRKGVTVYRGNVVLVQGSIRITGDIMTIYFKDDDPYTLIMQGTPARYRQLPDERKVYDEAEALRIEYHKLKNLVILIDKASFKQEGLSFSGSRIEYDTQRKKIKAKGNAKQQDDSSDRRVKVILKPNNNL